MSGKGRRTGRQPLPRGPRRLARRGGLVLFLLYALYVTTATWFVHHPREWLDDCRESLPHGLYDSLMHTGNFAGDITDGLGWTGSDTVYEYDTEAPEGQVLFAGEPRRTGPLAPDDIVTLDRGEFKIGWSAKLRHPVWCAYHVTREARHANSRKSFRQDREAANAPKPGDYEHTTFDRGHMVPNYAIVTRYGEEAQKKTFLTSNIAPQTPELNRGVWRDFEHRIAELWTARYGEVWVIVGSVPNSRGKTVRATGIELPDAYYQIVVAQEGMDIRALAVLLPQNVRWDEYAARNIVTIDRLEELTGLDFLPDLPSFIQTPLEAELPTRLWPVRFSDVRRLIGLHFDR